MPPRFASLLLLSLVAPGAALCHAPRAPLRPISLAQRTHTIAMSAAADGGLTALTTRPARAAMAATWIGFSVYVAAFSPGSFDVSPDSFDNRLIADAIADPSSLNPIFFAIFNALGLMPAVNTALLFPGSRDQSPLPTAPFVVASYALGYGAVGPYLALREPRPAPIARSELGFFTRYVTESRLYGVGLVAGALVLAKILADGSGADSVAAFGELFATSKLVHVSTIDLAVLSTFAFEPIREDMARRGWWDEGSPTDAQRNRLLAFCAVPVLGPSLYVALRPPLQE